ncbi:transmembrane protein, putative (macronuclear) [Tetrahymena thermophila SB210]|uniref:Transmembrane protein, putative n=1 Tax=Tetrahymena thermophila (strain SB210) TaxID=312017 RepID=W7XHC4_TETTS|nr:transmembrane protein, putative [Tetrahymena thermophila SB210]EWS72459.1 transmembrane protein, putative [Tetrahymena thermophila SB210]|eukprot:XP_012655004.1 transmembrane protein, putative [Tetrahymena thermophila SB210]
MDKILFNFRMNIYACYNQKMVVCHVFMNTILIVTIKRMDDIVYIDRKCDIIRSIHVRAQIVLNFGVAIQIIHLELFLRDFHSVIKKLQISLSKNVFSYIPSKCFPKKELGTRFSYTIEHALRQQCLRISQDNLEKTNTAYIIFNQNLLCLVIEFIIPFIKIDSVLFVQLAIKYLYPPHVCSMLHYFFAHIICIGIFKAPQEATQIVIALELWLIISQLHLNSLMNFIIFYPNSRFFVSIIISYKPRFILKPIKMNYNISWNQIALTLRQILEMTMSIIFLSSTPSSFGFKSNFFTLLDRF